MAWRARQRSENRRAGGLKGRDRGWLPGSTQANAIGIPHNLVNKTRERTNTLVTRDTAANIAGGQLTEPLPADFGDDDILIDTRSLVVNTNQLGGIGRFRSQFNVDADGIKHARYYLPIYPKDYFKKSIGDCNTICEKARPNSVIQIGRNSLHGITTQIPGNILTSIDIDVFIYSISVTDWLSEFNWYNRGGNSITPATTISDLFNMWWNGSARSLWAVTAVPPPDSQPSSGWHSLPRNSEESKLFADVYTPASYISTYQEWQNTLLNYGITDLWIMTNNSAIINSSFRLVFTKLTENPFDDYNGLPEEIRNGVEINILKKVELNTLRTFDIFFTNMFGPDGTVTVPQQITNNTNNTIGYTYVMQEVTPYNDNWSGFNVTPLWNDPNNFYPVSFNNPGGKIEFDYEIQSVNDMEIRFKFERCGWGTCSDGEGEACTEPSFFTDWVELPANSAGSKIINIPTQGSNEFSNIIFYLTEGTINITNVKLTCDPLT